MSDEPRIITDENSDTIEYSKKKTFLQAEGKLDEKVNNQFVSAYIMLGFFVTLIVLFNLIFGIFDGSRPDPFTIYLRLGIVLCSISILISTLAVAFCYKYLPMMKFYAWTNLANMIAMMMKVIVCYLYVTRKISAKSLWFLFLVPVAIELVMHFISQKIQNKVITFFVVIAQIQTMFIAINLGYLHYSNWNIGLFYFRIIFTMCLLLSIIMFFALFTVSIILMSKRETRSINNFLLGLGFSGCIFFFLSLFSVMYFFFQGVLNMFNDGKFDDGKQVGPLDPLIINTVKIYRILLIINLGLIFIGILSLIILKRRLINDMAKLLYLKMYLKKEKPLMMYPVSDVFFKDIKPSAQKVKSNDEENVKLLENDVEASAGSTNTIEKATPPDTCKICMINEQNIVLIPCKHSGVCEKCLKELLLTRTDCSYCQTHVFRYSVVRYDETTGSYLHVADIKKI